MTDILIRGFDMADWEQAAELYLQPRCIWGTFWTPITWRG